MSQLWIICVPRVAHWTLCVSLLLIWRFPAIVRSRARVNCLLSHEQHVRGSESYWRHGCKSTFYIYIFCCVGGGLARSPYSRKKVKKVKIKQPHYRPGETLRVPKGSGSQISRQSAHEGGEFVSPTHRSLLPPENIPGTHFCWRLSRLQSHSAFGRIVSMKIFHWHQRESNPRPSVQCLNQPRHRVPPPRKKESHIISLIKGKQIFQKSRRHLNILG